MQVRCLRALGLAVLVTLTAASLMAQDMPPRAEILQEVAHAKSDAVRNFPPQAGSNPASAIIALRKPGGNRPGGGGGGGNWTDADLKAPTATAAPLMSANFEGAGANGYIPPDTNLAVGPDQIVQTVNVNYQIFDKTGRSLAGPSAIHTIFAAFAGTSANMCATSDGGDPIVMYDQFAQRWFISQLEYNGSFTTNLICMAVSRSSDATGAYNLYAFNFGSSLPDYPKFGVWPDAYYMSANMFSHGSSFAGAKACAFDRTAMIAGVTAGGVCFQNSTAVYSLLPANADGITPPPGGEPDFFLQFTASSGVGNTLNLYKLHVGPSFSSTTGFTFTGPTALAVATYHEACGGGACVPQAGTTQQLDTLADRLMYRLAYRKFTDHESLVVNHSVQLSSSNKTSGVRWYEIQNPNGAASVVQQGTYGPDSTYRWMGSIAQDKAGNMALGYSYSSSAVSPGITYTGRLFGDPAGTMGNEGNIVAGTGSQTTYSRWGDYSSMVVDPDDCTFWYTTEYLATTGARTWQTKIASFKFSTCTP